MRLVGIAENGCVPLIAINDVLYHAPERRELQDVVTCIREHLTLETAGRLLEANAERHIKRPAEMARLFNLATEGVEAKLAFHICFGNRFGRSRFKRSYSDYFPGVLEARADQFVLEFASREMAEIEKWKEWNDGRELGAGIIDVKSFYPEAPEDVAARLRQVLQYAAADKVYVNPDCGFGWSPRNMAVGKLQAMVAGTTIVRQELTRG